MGSLPLACFFEHNLYGRRGSLILWHRALPTTLCLQGGIPDGRSRSEDERDQKAEHGPDRDGKNDHL